MLLECRECRGQLSSEASACPHCGCPIAVQSDPALDDKLSNDDIAIGCVLVCLAGGMKAPSIHDQLKKGLPERSLPAGLVTFDLVSRIERWHRFYLEVFRRGWAYSGMPPTAQISEEFFDKDPAETFLACRMCETWVKAALPKPRLDELIVAGDSLVASGWLHSRVIGEYQQLPEPKRSIVIATWNAHVLSSLKNRLGQ